MFIPFHSIKKHQALLPEIEAEVEKSDGWQGKDGECFLITRGHISQYWWIYKACLIAWKESKDPFWRQLLRTPWMENLLAEVSVITKVKIYNVFYNSLSSCQDLVRK